MKAGGWVNRGLARLRPRAARRSALFSACVQWNVRVEFDRACDPEHCSAAERLAAVRREIAAACRDAGREPASVTLVAISKTFGADAIEPVIAAGQRVFGENRVQEAKAKWPALKARHPDIELHLVGPLQSNKAQGGGGAVRRHPLGRPAEPRRGAGQGDRPAGPPADAVRRGQYRRRAAEGGRAAGGDRCIPRGLPRAPTGSPSPG